MTKKRRYHSEVWSTKAKRPEAIMPVVPDRGWSTRQRIMMFIQAFFELNGTAPTLQQIADGCNMSTSNVFWNVGKLESDGWIKASTYTTPLVLLKPVVTVWR